MKKPDLHFDFHLGKEMRIFRIIDIPLKQIISWIRIFAMMISKLQTDQKQVIKEISSSVGDPLLF